LGRWLKKHFPRASSPLHASKRARSAARTKDIGCDDDLPSELYPFDLHAALLRVEGKRKLLRKLLVGFFEQYQHAVAQLRTMIAAERYSDAELLVHTLKSVAGTLEARDLAVAARELETILRERRAEDLAVAMDALVGVLTPALEAAATLIRRNGARPGAARANTTGAGVS